MSLKARLDAAFNQFTVAKRAEETTRALNDYSNQPKEIHSHFTELVDRIFTSSGWGMHDLTLQNKKDFEAIMTFLGPTGVFLNVINKLQLDPFLRYTMPAISNGVNTDAPKEDELRVSAFQYYFYRFANFVTKNQLRYPSNKISAEDHIYHSLLVTYLEYYLPSSGSFPQEIGKSTSSNNFDQNMSSPKSRTSLRILRKTLSPSKRDLTQKIQPGQTSRTETFLTILSESFLAINNNVCPFEDQIRALRLTVKHLHSVQQNNTFVVEEGINDQSRVAAEIISKLYEPHIPKVFEFCCENWPWNTSFRLVQETYLSYIQPWRYQAGRNDPTRLSDEPSEAFKWKKYIGDNIKCYTANFNHFIRRLLRVNLCSAENAYGFMRITKIFNHRLLQQMIKTASQEKTWNQEMGPDGYSKSKQIDNEADGLSLAKELIRTAAICIQNFQRQQKPKPEPTRIQKYLIDFGIIEDIVKTEKEKEIERIITDLERGCHGLASIFGLESDLPDHFEMQTANTTIPDHESTMFGPRLTPRGRSQVMSGKYHLPVYSWVDPDFEAPIRNDEVYSLVAPLVNTSVKTVNHSHLHTAINLPGIAGQLFRFLFCHWNPLYEDFTEPRLKLRILSSKSVITWLGLALFLAIITGWWAMVTKCYIYCTAIVLILNYIHFQRLKTQKCL